MEQTREAQLEMFRQMTQVPHRAYGPMVKVFREGITDDPDYAARMMVHLFKTSKIRDQQDAAVIAMLSARGQLFHAYADYREAGRAMLLGSRVYDIKPDGPWGLEPFRIFRIIRFMASPIGVTRDGEEIERFHTGKAAQAALPRLARREMTKADRNWRPGPEDGDDALIRRLGLQVVRYSNHAKAPRLMRSIVKDYLLALQRDQDWWFAVEFLNRGALHSLYRNKSTTPRGFSPPDWVREAVFEDKYPTKSKRGALKAIAESNDPEVWFDLAKEYKLDDRILASVLPDTAEGKVVRVLAMTPTQVRNNLSWFEREGMLEIPEVKEAIMAKVAMATQSTGAFERESAQVTDSEVAATVKTARDKAAKSGQQIEGEVAVCVDISGSMHQALQKGALLAAHIAANASNQVWMSVFNTTGRAYNVTGYNLSDIEELTSRLRVGGGTSMSAAWRAMKDQGFTPNKAVWVTDEGENSGPQLHRVLQTEEWEGQTSIVRVGRPPRDLSERLTGAGFAPDIIETQNVEDNLLAEQVAELLGGPAAQTIADKIAATEIPYIVR